MATRSADPGVNLRQIPGLRPVLSCDVVHACDARIQLGNPLRIRFQPLGEASKVRKGVVDQGECRIRALARRFKRGFGDLQPTDFACRHPKRVGFRETRQGTGGRFTKRVDLRQSGMLGVDGFVLPGLRIQFIKLLKLVVEKRGGIAVAIAGGLERLQFAERLSPVPPCVDQLSPLLRRYAVVVEKRELHIPTRNPHAFPLRMRVEERIPKAGERGTGYRSVVHESVGAAVAVQGPPRNAAAGIIRIGELALLEELRTITVLRHRELRRRFRA